MNTSEIPDPSLTLDDPLLQQTGMLEPSGFIHEGETFQHYQVLRRPDGSLWELGRGAMGVTYKAFDTNLRCHVALKVISGQHLHSEVAGQRFIREARVAARLRHPNIASVYHLGVDPQGFFYSMEFIDGETLEDLVERVGPLPPETVLRIALQTARALASASRQGLIHRDIKPANLMVLHQDEDGEDRLLVKVIDFGLARSYDTNDSNPQLTATGFVGTPLYASPEQLEERVLDVRSDIYSLGVTLWILLTGRPPFAGKMTQVISHHLYSQPPWEYLGGCPDAIRTLLERMLHKDPADRFQTAGELRTAIESCLRSMAGTSDLFTGETDAGGPSDGLSPAFLAARSEAVRSTAGTLAGVTWRAATVTGLRTRFEPVRRLARERPRRLWSSVGGAAAILCVGSFFLWHRSLGSAEAAQATTQPAASAPAAIPSEPPVPVVVATSFPATEAAATPEPPAYAPVVAVMEDTPTLPAAEVPPPAAVIPEVRQDEPWRALVGDNPAPATPDPAPEAPAADGFPLSAAMSPVQAAQVSPAATATNRDGEDDQDDKPAASKSRQRSARNSPSRRTAKRAPVPAPNLFQKIFGIKPKPKAKSR